MDDVHCGRNAGAATCLLVNSANERHASNEYMVDFPIRELKELLQIVEVSNDVSPRNSPTMRPLAVT